MSEEEREEKKVWRFMSDLTPAERLANEVQIECLHSQLKAVCTVLYFAMEVVDAEELTRYVGDDYVASARLMFDRLCDAVDMHRHFDLVPREIGIEPGIFSREK
jgi:hypothetical protein|tara:strand:- start:284 stop:595 length:312 start_codon:yes stop_codon:yes gene_type:complete